MKQYVELVKRILADGELRHDRTGVGTLSVFGGHLSFDLRERFPLVTIKKTLYEKAFTEMLWFLRGEDHIEWLAQNGAGAIWGPWADENGKLGPIYGCQWRNWNGEGIDQIRNLIDGIRRNPLSRRHIVSAWNPSELGWMALPPCHRDFQCYVSNDGHLDLMVAQRSWDVALGAPFNIAQYALLAHLIARQTGLAARHLKFNYGDAHLYTNHVDAMVEVAKLEPIDCNTRLVFHTEQADIDGYKPADFSIDGYESHPFVRLEVAV